ncbi:cytochrome b/b6 domain-containing protein [Thauera sinica]|uniref:cytochrome b/b6 domain-containing protein n=1 Tax=Thauera sp. K11 TaxID=2005884 RepID=UPI0018E000B3|nr:cytochrome b/b6 domain-containing protein [Thauera sp. K11]
MGQPALRKIRVWDLPVRLFHWALPVLMTVLFLSAYAGQMQVHARMGTVTLVLVLFRLVWGFVGSQTARFSDFVTGIGGIHDYLSGKRPKTTGHNPLGAWMILAMLATLLIQSLSGLFSSDSIAFDGPLAHWIGHTAANLAARVHTNLAYAIDILIAVHVLAVVLHWALRGENLIMPMLSGNKHVPADVGQPAFSNPALALTILVLIALLIAAVALAE